MTIRAEVEGIGPVEFEDGTPESVIDATIKRLVRQGPQKPNTGRVGLNAINQGIAGGIDSILNTPSNLMNLAKAGAGYAMGNMGVPAEYLPEVSEPPNLARRGFESAGFIDPQFNPQDTAQRIVASTGRGLGGAMVSPVGSLPQLGGAATAGAVSGLTSGATKEATGSDVAADIVGMLAPTGVQLASQRGQNQIAAKAQERQRNAVRDKTLADAQAQGYKIQPSEVRPNSSVNNIIESIAGKAAVKQAAQLENQPITNRLAGEELRTTGPLTAADLKARRESLAWPYREASAISRTAELTVERLKQVRFDAKEQANFYARTGDPGAGQKMRGLQSQEKALELRLEKIVKQAGKPDLVNDLKEARRDIAKTYSVEDALNPGDASVSAPALGRALVSGDPLSGNLEKIAKFAVGPGRQVVQEGAKVQAPGVSALNPMMAGVFAGQGAAAAGPAGLLAGGLPFLRGPARDMVMSDWYQSIMARPDYSPGMINRLMANLPIEAQQGLFQSLQALRGGLFDNQE